MTMLLACVGSAEQAARAAAAGFDGVMLDRPPGEPWPSTTVCWIEPASGEGGAPAGATLILMDAATRLVLAHWLDRLPSDDDVGHLAQHGRAGLLLHGADRLLDSASFSRLSDIADLCRAQHLKLGLMGGLEPPDVPRLLALQPDLLVFGRALRQAQGDLDPDRMRTIRDLVPRAGKLASDGPRREMRKPAESGRSDRIFVHDLVLAISIGAYASEFGRTQRVRFTVDATLIGAGRPVRDMRDIVSYDLISDTIRTLTTGRHVDFVETLAEEIAERVLAHPRITSVRIVVEKLEVGPGAVGVEIRRDKA